jgi:hypothetical protein
VEKRTDAARRDRRLIAAETVAEEDDSPWKAPPSRQIPERPLAGPLPAKLSIILGDQLYLNKADLTPALTGRLRRLAAFQNPEFYKAQAMRLNTYGKPRVICCAEETHRSLRYRAVVWNRCALYWKRTTSAPSYKTNV